MDRPPAYPSHPPPPPDESVRPMSFFAAGLWVFGIQLSFFWLLTLLWMMKESAERDLVSRVICQVVAYAFGMFLLLRAKGPHAPIRHFVALRKTSFALYPLAALLGAMVAPPAHQALGYIEKRWPREESAFDFVTIFSEVSTPERILIAIGFIAIGPLMEEALFRGAIFGPLRQQAGSAAVVVATAFFFSLIHIEPRRLLPIFVLGLVLGYLRSVSGSMIPSLLMHMCFNAVPFIGLIGAATPPESDADLAATLSPSSFAAYLGGCVVLLILIHVVASHSRKAQAARADE